MITDYRRPTRTASLFGLGLVLALGCVALSGAVTVDAEACPPEKAEKTEKSGSCCGGDAPELTIASPDAGDGKGTIGWVMKPSGKEGGGFVFRRADGGDAGSGGGSGEKKIEKRFEFRVGGDGAKGGAGKKGDAKTFVWRSDGNSGVWLEGDGGEPGGMWRSADGDTFEIELPDIDVDFDVDLPEFDFTEMDFDLPEFDFTEMDVDGTYDVIIADGSGNEPKVFRGKLGDGEMAIGKAFGGAIGLGGGKGGVKIEGLPGLRSGGRSGSKVGGGSSSGGCPHCKHCNRATPGSKNEKVEIIRLGDGNFTFEGLPGGGDMLRKKVIRLRGDGDVHLDHDVELDHDVDIQVHGEILDGDGNRFHVLRPGGGGSIGSAGSGTGSHVIRLRGEGLGGGGSGGGGKKGTAVYEIRGQGGGGGGAAGGKKSGTYRYEIRTDGQGGGGTCVPKSDGEHRVIRLGDDVEGEVRVEVLVSPESPESGNRVLRVPEGKAGNKKFEIRLKGDGEEIHDVILEPGSGTPKVKKRVRRDLRTL